MKVVAPRSFPRSWHDRLDQLLNRSTSQPDGADAGASHCAGIAVRQMSVIHQEVA